MPVAACFRSRRASASRTVLLRLPIHDQCRPFADLPTRLPRRLSSLLDCPFLSNPSKLTLAWSANLDWPDQATIEAELALHAHGYATLPHAQTDA